MEAWNAVSLKKRNFGSPHLKSMHLCAAFVWYERGTTPPTLIDYTTDVVLA